MVTRRTFCAAAAVLAALVAPVAHAQLLVPVETPEINMIGLGVGSAPDYSGSSHQKTVAAPIFRYQWEGSQRYFQWLGPTMVLNLVNHDAWRAGPMLNFRAARDTDVDDAVVRQMDEIDAKVEGGAFLQYNLRLSNNRAHQIVFGGDIAGSSNGTVAHLRTMWWHPFSTRVIGNLGVGLTYGNDKFMETYYGVMSARDIALFPSLGGQHYKPDRGLVGFNIPVGVQFLLSTEWLLTVGARYEKLHDDAKDSPVVTLRGDDIQWIGGVALSYLF